MIKVKSRVKYSNGLFWPSRITRENSRGILGVGYIEFFACFNEFNNMAEKDKG